LEWLRGTTIGVLKRFWESLLYLASCGLEFALRLGSGFRVAQCGEGMNLLGIIEKGKL
jgi:hypothetical protein